MTRLGRFFVLSVVLAAAPSMHAFADALKKEAPPVTKVSLEAARKTALARVAGKVHAEELEKEDGRWIFSFEIKPDGETQKIIKEVNVDANTGEVVSVETEPTK